MRRAGLGREHVEQLGGVEAEPHVDDIVEVAQVDVQEPLGVGEATLQGVAVHVQGVGRVLNRKVAGEERSQRLEELRAVPAS